MSQKPQVYHDWTVQEMYDELHGKERTEDSRRHWASIEWYHDTVEAMRVSMRELLQHCNNADVAEKAWKVLDAVEVGE